MHGRLRSAVLLFVHFLFIYFFFVVSAHACSFDCCVGLLCERRSGRNSFGDKKKMIEYEKATTIQRSIRLHAAAPYYGRTTDAMRERNNERRMVTSIQERRQRSKGERAVSLSTPPSLQVSIASKSLDCRRAQRLRSDVH